MLWQCEGGLQIPTKTTCRISRSQRCVHVGPICEKAGKRPHRNRNNQSMGHDSDAIEKMRTSLETTDCDVLTEGKIGHETADALISYGSARK